MIDLDWLTPCLAIGAAFPASAAEALAKVYSVGAVIDLRAEAQDDAATLRVYRITWLGLPTPDHHAIVPTMLRDGVAFSLAQIGRGRRVLIHCQNGIGRSAVLALCVLVELGLAPLTALALAKARRSCVSPSPQQLEGWTAWLRGRGCRAPSFAELAAIAYRQVEP